MVTCNKLVVILEPTEVHTESGGYVNFDVVRRFKMAVPVNDTELAVAEAIKEVERMGYKVILNSDGGCCEYVSPSFDEEDYIVVTVEPKNLISAE